MTHDTMRITIHYNECDFPVEIACQRGHEYLLDDLLDSFVTEQVREIINQNLRLFEGLRDAWNQRELAQRRAMGLNQPGKED